MSDFVSLSDAQERLVSAVCEHKLNPQASLRALISHFSIPIATIHHACNTVGTEAAIMEISNGRGRNKVLTEAEETMIVKAALELQNAGTTLCCVYFKDLPRALIQILSFAGHAFLGFSDDRTGKRLIDRLLSS